MINPISRNAALHAVSIEEELDGPMPDTLHAMIAELGHAEALRIVVRLTKKNIYNRILQLPSDQAQARAAYQYGYRACYENVASEATKAAISTSMITEQASKLAEYLYPTKEV